MICCCFMVRTTATASLSAAAWWPWERRASTRAAQVASGSATDAGQGRPSAQRRQEGEGEGERTALGDSPCHNGWPWGLKLPEVSALSVMCEQYVSLDRMFLRCTLSQLSSTASSALWNTVRGTMAAGRLCASPRDPRPPYRECLLGRLGCSRPR